MSFQPGGAVVVRSVGLFLMILILCGGSTAYADFFSPIIRTLPRSLKNSQPKSTPLAEIGEAATSPAMRNWRDASGEFSIMASLEAIQGDVIRLKKENGQMIDIAAAMLHAEDQSFLRNSRTIAVADKIRLGVIDLAQIDKMAAGCNRASDALALYEAFSQKPGLNEIGKEMLAKRMVELTPAAELNQVRLKNEWVSIDDYEQARQSQMRMIADAEQAYDSRHPENYQSAIERAGRELPENILPDFLLGIFHVVVSRTPKYAIAQFSKCERNLLSREHSLEPHEQANLVAVYHNLSVAHLRSGNVATAISFMNRQRELGVVPVETAQNIRRMLWLADLAEQSGITRAASKISVRQRNQLLEIVAASSSSNLNFQGSWKLLSYVENASASNWRDPQSWNMMTNSRLSFEDDWCLACYGSEGVPCPVTACSGGTVRSIKTTVTQRNSGPLYIDTPIRVRCNNCRGSGVVDCPICRDGKFKQ